VESEKTYPTYFGEYGYREGKGDYFSVKVEVFSGEGWATKEVDATVHFPFLGNLFLFLRDVAQEYGESAIVNISTSRQGS